MTTRITKYIVPLALATALTAFSCVRESGLEECPPDGAADGSMSLYIDFAPKLYPTRISPLQAEVETMYVFVFGHDGHYVTTLEDHRPEIGPEYTMPLSGLPAADYEFIGWSNLHEDFCLPELDLTPGVTTVHDLFVELDTGVGDTIRSLPLNLHYGRVRQPVTDKDGHREYHMSLDRYTYTVNIITEGLEPDQRDYRYVIGDNNGRLGFYSEDISDKTIYYMSDCTKDAEGQLSASLRVLRLMESHVDATIRIEDTESGEAIYDDKLIVRLLSLREAGETVDFSTKYEYTIKLVFSGGVLMAITIDGWVVYKYDDYEI